MRSRTRRMLRLGSALLVASLLACQASEQAPVLPAGPLIAGDARVLERLVGAVEQFEDTPLWREALRAREAVRPCKEFLASASGSGSLFEALTCDAQAEMSPALRSLRKDAALVFVFPVGDSEPTADTARLAGRVHVEADGSLRVEARFEPLSASGWSSLFIPADRASGPGRLSRSRALVQGRMHPRAGIDLASLVPSGSQADAMFRLKSELFVGAALGDAWEFAIYMPAPGHSMPPMALAVDVSSPSLAQRGVGSFVSELEAAWPIRARRAEWEGGISGACFYELRIMPEFAPCYAIHRDSLIFGWNSQSVATALGDPAGDTLGAPARLVAHLDRFPEADARLAESALGQPSTRIEPAAGEALPAVSAGPQPARPRFSKLVLEASADSDAIALRVHLQAAAP